jgi:hypothetical protein
MELDLWAQLNLLGHVSYSDYLNMDHEEARACYLALKRAIDAAKHEQSSRAAFESHASNYQNLLGGR